MQSWLPSPGPRWSLWMFWWQHTGPRVAWLTCSEILIFIKIIKNIYNLHRNILIILRLIDDSIPENINPRSQHFTNEFPRIPRDKCGVNQPRVSIKSQLIIKPCWAWTDWDWAGTGGDLNARPSQLGLMAGRGLTGEVREGELRADTGGGLVCPAEARLTDWLSGSQNPSPPPSPPASQGGL